MMTRERAQLRRILARADRPSRCPDCGTENVPSHRMRGRLDRFTEDIIWSCSSCTALALRLLKQHGLHTCYCDWCCERFNSPRPHRFCGKHCEWAHQRATAAREQAAT